ncbi:MAG: ATP-grasp domain-containing protein [Deltaproteobacteria bacterium]|nr:ATP-grasp domain-containing protein [Deltaproteobacteria bacterium]
MNYIFLSPHFPENFKYFAKNLASRGVNVLGVGDHPWEALDSELKDSLREYYRVWNMDSYDELIRGCGFFTHQYGKIDFIESHNEHWLETEAALRTDFNVSGIKNDTIGNIRKKSLMKNVFKKAGIRVAKGYRPQSTAEIIEFVEKTGYPVVAKPDSGVGASSTLKITSKKELDEFCKDLRNPEDYFLEEFIEGQIQSWDGLAGPDGEILFETSHIFSMGVMETVNHDGDIYYYNAREIPDDLKTAGRNVLREFGIKMRFFHIEFFRTPENSLVALEVNMRPPGGLTLDMFNYANDIDIYEQYARVVTGEGFNAEVKYPYHCAYVARKNGKSYRHTHEDVIKKMGQSLVHYQPISGVFRNALGDIGYLIRNSELDQIIESAHFIQEKS